MLAVRMNLLVSLPVLGSLTTKHFMLFRIVARITSPGIERNSFSNDPIATTGHSTSPATSSSSASSSTSSQPCANASCLASAWMMSLRPCGSSTTFAA